MTNKAFSFGGGVQSMAALVLAAQGEIDYKTFLFSNVGDDSEYPATIRYLHDVAIPYAQANGLDLQILRKMRLGQPETLWESLMRDNRSIGIPVRMSNGAPGNRSCTADFKIKVIAKWMKEHGATKAAPGAVGIGISLDEFQRMKDSLIPYIRNEYPLIDLRLDRQDCKNLIARAGLPVPPKSSCFFCPFHTVKVWQELYDQEPELFQRSVMLERTLNERLRSFGKDEVWLTGKCRPLDEVVDGSHQNQLTLSFEPDEGQHSCGPFVCAAS